MKQLITAVALATSCASTQASICATDTVPAATLLVPYFEVDLDSCDSFGGRNTTFTINNTQEAAQLAHVTLWTNAGVPALTFDIYLNGFARQAIDLENVLCDGALPTTGSAFDPGAFGAPVSFPGCNDTTTPGAAPAYGGAGAIDGTALSSLRAALTGAADPTSGLCSGIGADNVARGYVTIDQTTECTLLAPSDPGYYSGILGMENSLSGQFSLVDSANNFATGYAAVAIEAATAGVFAAGDTTFYGRYNSASAADAREPLPTTYAPRFRIGPASGSTDLLVWRELGGDAAPFACGATPSAIQPGFSNQSGEGPVFAIDDQGNHLNLTPGDSFGLATQRVSVEQTFPNLAAQITSGAIWLNLQHDQTAYEPSADPLGQGWATSIRASAGRFATSGGAQPLDSSCNGGTFDETSEGPTTTFLNP